MKKINIDAKTLKVLGVVGTVIGAGASLLGSWVGEKQLDIKVAEKVTEALTKKSE